MDEAREREFWQKIVTCIEALAQVIQIYKLATAPSPGRVFEPGMAPPKAEKEFWLTMRRNLLSLAAIIKTYKIGGSAGVKLGEKRRQRYRPPRLDKPPGKRS